MARSKRSDASDAPGNNETVLRNVGPRGSEESSTPDGLACDETRSCTAATSAQGDDVDDLGAVNDAQDMDDEWQLHLDRLAARYGEKFSFNEETGFYTIKIPAEGKATGAAEETSDEEDEAGEDVSDEDEDEESEEDRQWKRRMVVLEEKYGDAFVLDHSTGWYFLDNGPGSYVMNFAPDEEEQEKEKEDLATYIRYLSTRRSDFPYFSLRYQARVQQNSAATIWLQRLADRWPEAMQRVGDPTYLEPTSRSCKEWEKDQAIVETIKSFIEDLKDDCVFVYRIVTDQTIEVKCSLPCCRNALRNMKYGKRCLTIEMTMTGGLIVSDQAWPPTPISKMLEEAFPIYLRSRRNDHKLYRGLVRKWFCVRCVEKMWRAIGPESMEVDGQDEDGRARLEFDDGDGNWDGSNEEDERGVLGCVVDSTNSRKVSMDGLR